MNWLDALATVGISATPVFELRGGLPFALARGALPAHAFGLAVLGNLLIVPLVLWGFKWMEDRLLRWRLTRPALSWVLTRSRRKGRLVQQLGALGLVLLVALPLPGTGAWTGAIVARLLGIPPRRAWAWISLGVLGAGVLVLLASLGAIRAFGLQRA